MLRSDQPCSTSLHGRASKERGERTIGCALSHVNNLHLLWDDCYSYCQASNVWRRNMSLSRERRQQGSRKQSIKKTFIARVRTFNRLISNNFHGAQGFALLAHSLLLNIKFKFSHCFLLTTFGCRKNKTAAYLLLYSYTAFMFKHRFNNFP